MFRRCDSDSSDDNDTEQLRSISHDDYQRGPFEYLDPLLTDPLSYAIGQRDNQNIEALLKKKRNLNNIDNNGNTPLHCAVLENDEATVKILLARPDVRKDAQNFRGETPLFLSVKNKLSNITQHLLNENCSVNISNNMSKAPLHLSIENFVDSSGVHELIKRGANINAKDGNKYTPLHYAVETDNFEIVCMLLYYGADVNLFCVHQLTPLMLAVNDNSKIDIARELIKYYADFSQCCYDGYNALLLAANAKHLAAFDLIEAGADVNCVTPEGQDLVFFARHFNFDFFKLVFTKINHELLLKNHIPFLLSFLLEGSISFTPEEWVESIFLILDSPVILELVNQCKNITQFNTVKYLLHNFNRKRIPAADRIKIIYGFLSYGLEVEPDDLNAVYRIFGIGKEFEAFSQVVDADKECKWYLIRYLLGVESDSQMLYRRFFNYKNYVPSLIELARNQTREYIIEKGNITKPYQFYDFVRKLNIPKVIEDIIFCKKHFCDTE